LNIKPSNIYINQKGTYILGNFDNSVFVDIAKNITEGNKNYLAPEFLSHAFYNKKIDLFKADIFSLG